MVIVMYFMFYLIIKHCIFILIPEITQVVVYISHQNRDFLFIFDRVDQIEKFAQRMIKYWEKEENYEVCAEIIKLKKKMISKWKKIMAEDTNEGEEIKEWLKSSL